MNCHLSSFTNKKIASVEACLITDKLSFHYRRRVKCVKFHKKMEHETIKYNADIEEGELSDSDGAYTPLQRPDIKLHEKSNVGAAKMPHHQQHEHEQQKTTKMDEGLEDIDDSQSDFGQSSDSSTDSDDMIYKAVKGTDHEDDVSKQKKKQKRKRTVLLRVKPNEDSTMNEDEQQQTTKSKFKKYNIWTASLQEESLSENMRGIDVNKYPKSDRNVESYDFSWKYNLERKNIGGFKRRYSSAPNSGDDLSDSSSTFHCYQNKRSKLNSGGDRKSIKGRGRFNRRESSSSCDSQNAPRYILDLTVTLENDDQEIARDIANKLFEEKDELIVRAVEILGKEMPIELFKETQRIERDGGMMVINGIRRRTPGGVFLFLLKHHDDISAENKKLIFRDDVKETYKGRKKSLTTKRDKKVEELKKQLSLKENELPALSKRIDIPSSMCHLKPDTHTNLSNPPPSPVTNAGLESSPDYSLHAINHVNDASPEKTTNRSLDDEPGLVTYDDDFVEMNYSDMDMF